MMADLLKRPIADNAKLFYEALDNSIARSWSLAELCLYTVRGPAHAYSSVTYPTREGTIEHMVYTEVKQATDAYYKKDMAGRLFMHDYLNGIKRALEQARFNKPTVRRNGKAMLNDILPAVLAAEHTAELLTKRIYVGVTDVIFRQKTAEVRKEWRMCQKVWAERKVSADPKVRDTADAAPILAMKWLRKVHDWSPRDLVRVVNTVFKKKKDALPPVEYEMITEVSDQANYGTAELLQLRKELVGFRESVYKLMLRRVSVGDKKEDDGAEEGENKADLEHSLENSVEETLKHIIHYGMYEAGRGFPRNADGLTSEHVALIQVRASEMADMILSSGVATMAEVEASLDAALGDPTKNIRQAKYQRYRELTAIEDRVEEMDEAFYEKIADLQYKNQEPSAEDNRRMERLAELKTLETELHAMLEAGTTSVFARVWKDEEAEFEEDALLFRDRRDNEKGEEEKEENDEEVDEDEEEEEEEDKNEYTVDELMKQAEKDKDDEEPEEEDVKKIRLLTEAEARLIITKHMKPAVLAHIEEMVKNREREKTKEDKEYEEIYANLAAYTDVNRKLAPTRPVVRQCALYETARKFTEEDVTKAAEDLRAEARVKRREQLEDNARETAQLQRADLNEPPYKRRHDEYPELIVLDLENYKRLARANFMNNIKSELRVLAYDLVDALAVEQVKWDPEEHYHRRTITEEALPAVFDAMRNRKSAEVATIIRDVDTMVKEWREVAAYIETIPKEEDRKEALMEYKTLLKQRLGSELKGTSKQNQIDILETIKQGKTFKVPGE